MFMEASQWRNTVSNLGPFNNSLSIMNVCIWILRYQLLLQSQIQIPIFFGPIIENNINKSTLWQFAHLVNWVVSRQHELNLRHGIGMLFPYMPQ